jgi:hypothetical protein
MKICSNPERFEKMAEDEKKRLVELIKRVAEEVFTELLDEHLDDYEHKEARGAREDGVYHECC